MAGIVGRGDLLAHFFGLLAIVIYMHGCGATYSKPTVHAPPTKVPYVSVVVTALLIGSAMLCKETGVCVLAIIAILDVTTICNLEPLQLIPTIATAVKFMAASNAGSSSSSNGFKGKKEKRGKTKSGKKGGGDAKAAGNGGADGGGAAAAEAAAATAALEPAAAAALLTRQLVMWLLTGAMMVARFRMNRDDEVVVDWSTNPVSIHTHTQARARTHTLRATAATLAAPCVCHLPSSELIDSSFLLGIRFFFWELMNC